MTIVKEKYVSVVRTVSVSALFMLGVHQAVWAQGFETAQTNLPREQLTVGKATMDVQIASTFNQRQVGLMHRKSMPANEGMLFVFPQKAVQCFWMKNTHLPLTAAFIDEDGTIVNMADMQPLSEQNHCSTKPVPYVLEMKQGWFKRNKIRTGMRVQSVNKLFFALQQ